MWNTRTTKRCCTSSYWNFAIWTHYSSPTEVALAFCSSKSEVQARMPSATVVGWTNTALSSFWHSAYCWADNGRPQLRFASERICVVPLTYNSFTDKSFSAAGPHVWNALPSYLWQILNYRHFKHALKGHVFWVVVSHAALWLICFCVLRSPLTSLLTEKTCSSCKCTNSKVRWLDMMKDKRA